MQLLVDFLPIVIFFAAYKFAGMYVATKAIIIVMVAQVAIQWLRKRQVSRMLLISTGIVIVLGSITLLLRNPIFIQWKPTIVYWIFGIALLASQFWGEQTLIQRMMGSAITLSEAMWRQINVMWTVYFVVLGAANLYVAYHFSEATWVNFKLFGTLILTVVIVVIQTVWITLRAPAHEEPEGEDE